MSELDFSNVPTPVIRVLSNTPFDLDYVQRKLRDQLLRDNVDTMNPIRYAGLTNEQQAEIAQYRTDLLNVPQQAGWPTDVNWPTKPSWL